MQRQEWNDEIVGALKRLWTEGNSASRVAEKLEVLFGIKFTRNAIIGKIHRLIDAGKMAARGDYAPKHDNRPLEKRHATNEKRVYKKKPKPEPVAVAPPTPRATVAPPVYGENVILFPLRSTVTGPTTLENVRGCLYAVGANARGQHMFCNADKKEGSAYCEEHHAKCHIPKVKADPKAVKKWRPF
jgi:GcrA cell cycle regulator